MAFVHHASSECSKTELDLFSVPPTQTGLESGRFIDFHPISNIGDNGPIEFLVSGAGTEYMDLARTQLYVKAKVTKPDGTNIDDDAKVGPANLFLNALFVQADVSLNGKLVSSATNTNPYRAYMETTLSYGPAAKNSQLTSALFYKDRAGYLDETDPTKADKDENMGLKERYNHTKKSKSVEMMGRIHEDIFNIDRLMINGVDLRLKLTRSKNEFCLLSPVDGANFKVVIEDVILFIRKEKVSPSVLLGHAEALRKTTAKYPITRIDFKMFSVPRGALNISQDNVFNGNTPKRIFITMVDNDAYSGNYKKNPFNFKTNDLSFLGVYVDGEPLPGKPLQPKFGAHDNFIMAYQSLYAGTSTLFQDLGNDISRDEFNQGYAIFCFDLTPDLCNDAHYNLIKKGNLRLELQFSQALAQSINVLILAEFENLIEIDNQRNVLFDFTN
ncbi:uncharacterized protein F54H12.2 [Exaiptasia diaphana]|uniref:Uncharacterized protein n=1 Tax=Exaiptasia diaphana TaxID=2652724 RepID=A0A913XW03_EXADI|nr:uncharacterized protein F54H12.2 [Exaiptasia diaphana]